MGYAYILCVEEDLAKLGVPEPSEEDVVTSWQNQGGQGAPPAQIVPHIRHALTRARFHADRDVWFADVDEVQRWAAGNLSWRPLLENETLGEILAENGSLGLYREFYSERPNAWFDSERALELVEAAQADSRHGTLDGYVQKELDAFRRVLDVLVRHRLRFRFDFSP